ncbi:hypothetical protein Ciccas_005115 [Cichlidogyrus casuarinus]|uniref:Uncharacterized protein n=1 Tax=Cichlidogyrus casuarinus TaxID=1844966 RepID=A0ABD2QAH4_9PLAT
MDTFLDLLPNPVDRTPINFAIERIRTGALMPFSEALRSSIMDDMSSFLDLINATDCASVLRSQRF